MASSMVLRIFLVNFVIMSQGQKEICNKKKKVKWKIKLVV
jgi:hypothetical protein